MKNVVRIGTSIVFGLMVTFTLSQAEAGDLVYQGTSSLVFFSGDTQIDTNGDGATADRSTMALDTTLGKGTAQILGEGAVVEPTGFCPADQLEIASVMLHGVHRFENPGDLLFVQMQENTICLDLTTGTLTAPLGRGTFTGGTGRFAGASGTFESTGAGGFLFSDPTSGQGFGYFVGDFNGVITVPDGNDGGGTDCSSLALLGLPCP